MSEIIKCDVLSTERLIIENETGQAKIVLDAGDSDNPPSIKILGKNMIEIVSNGDTYCKILLKSPESAIELSVIDDIPSINISSNGQVWSWPPKH